MDSNKSKVWSKIEAKKKDGSVIKLRFQDLPISRLEEALEFTLTYMLRDEAVHKASGVYKSEAALQEYRTVLDALFSEEPPHVTMCCVDDDTDDGGDFAGMSTLMLMKQGQSFAETIKQFPVATKEMNSLFDTAAVLEKTSDIHKQFDSHYHGAGVVVHPDFRGLGIANEFIRLRTPICQEHNVPMTGAWMTAIGTQRASANNNWKIDAEIKPETLGEKCSLTFEDTSTVFKHMYTTSK